MKQLIFSLLAIVCLQYTSKANEFYEELFEQGNQVYDLGEYDSAISIYSQVVNANFQSPLLYYNLGNAYFKSNQLAPAIYYYEMALKMDPSNADIQFNLEMANSQIADRIQKKPTPILTQAYLGISTLLSPNSWGYATLILFVLALTLLTLYLLSGNSSVKQLSFFAAIGLFGSFALAFGIGQMVKSDWTKQDKGIVFTSTLNVKAEPKLAAADLFVIHEGTKVDVLEQADNWIRIALPDGNEGWVQTVDVKTY